MAWGSRVQSRIQTGFEDGALSQNPTQLTLEVTHIEVTEADCITTSLDKHLVRIRKIFAAGNPSSETKHIFEEYTLKNEKYGRLPDDALAWVVPKDVRLQICRLCHDNVEHLSVQETLKRITRNYWFPKIRRFISNMLKPIWVASITNMPARRGSVD